MELGFLGVGIMMGLAILGCGIAQGWVASKTVESMARQPELYGKLRTVMILALGIIEALAIYGLLIAFILMGKF